MTSRYDISNVRPQGGYIAKKCPVVIQNRVLVPELETEPDLVIQQRMQAGVDFEDTLLDQFSEATDGDHLVLDGNLSKPDLIEATVAAMEAANPFIWNGFLPVDEQGRRTGKPDLLARHQDGYLPIDVKHHMTLNAKESGKTLVSPLDTPSLEAAFELEGFALRPSKDDAHQLAHYHRMLEACGYGTDSTMAAIIGKEGYVVWYDLAEPRWTTRSTSGERKTKRRSTLDTYDHEFSFRLDVAAVAATHQKHRTTDLLVDPVRIGDCASCGFNNVCTPTLEKGEGHPSLIPRIGFSQWRQLQAAGITDRQMVADLHYPTAVLVASKVDVEKLLGLTEEADPDTSIQDLIPRAKKQIETLTNAGYETVADLEPLDPTTATLGGYAAEAILNARAALGPEPVYRRHGQDAQVPRADIEVDLDMENVLEGVYLWGALLTHQQGTIATQPGYHPFATFDHIDEQAEIDVFSQMWSWLKEVQQQAKEQGLSFKCYVWHEPAENGQLRRITKNATHLSREVEDLIQSDEWVDLKKEFEQRFITGGSSSLKTIAPLAGFEWDVDDAGGAMSMIKFQQAQEGNEESEEWLLTYNKGDVEATLGIREWIGDNHDWRFICV